jgi:long-chain acyl-CoA synthetase
LAQLSGRHGDNPAVACGEKVLTWDELDDRSTRLGRGLEAAGLPAGGHVAICVSNRVEFVEAVLGAWRAGAAYTPLKTGWTADEVGAVLDDAGTAVVVTDRDGARVAARARGIPVVDPDSGYDDWLAAQSDVPFGADRCGYKLPFTSGTTGRPKGVRMTGSGSTPFAVGWAGIARWAQALSLPGDGVHLFVSKLFNGAPQTFGFGALARGATLRIMTAWNPETALRELTRGDVTSTIMVPTMFRQLLALDVDRHPVPSLQTILHGGEPCPVAVKQAVIDWFGEVLVEYYGFTEGGMTVVGPADWRAHPGTVGKPLSGMAVRIVGEHGDDLPTGQEGTVYFESSAGRRFTYQGDDARTAAAHRANAFTVGDVGRLDEDGFLYLCGRSADVVICAGVNVYPAEIEAALADVPGIADLCAVGMPDPERGEAVALFVSLRQDTEPAVVLARLDDVTRERVAPYKRPREVHIVEEIPRDQTGKLLRRVLRDPLWPTG